MTTIIAAALLAAMSVLEYPSRQQAHDQLRAQFIEAVRTGDTETMRETCEKGVALLPDDPTWRYNLACALSYYKDQEAALDTLEKAIDLGFRDAEQILGDRDLKRLGGNARFKELVEEARRLQGKPILMGPLSATPATGIFGESVAVGEQNLSWDFDAGCFDVRMNLAAASSGGNTGDLYVNRDAGHSVPVVTNWPGLTPVRFDSRLRESGLTLDFPNMLFPYPVFGNCSRALTTGPYWRSIPRALMTTEAHRLKAMHKFYLSNQIWCFPVTDDYNFATNKFGDVFFSVTPYWIATQGISWSDQYYLRLALEISRSLPAATKREAVRRKILAPTIQYILRRSLRTCREDDDYLTAKAHPTCFPPNGIDRERMKKLASSLKPSQLPPVASIIGVNAEGEQYKGALPELTYLTPCAWAFVLRSSAPKRSFALKAVSPGASELTFAIVHDENGAASLERLGADTARITLDKSLMTPTNRVDLAVFARTNKSGWGAPSFISFAVANHSVPYSDPVLTPLDEPEAEPEEISSQKAEEAK